MPSVPTISVVVPCYNGAAFLAEAVSSAMQQTAPPLEVLVIDDGSTDGSAAVAETFGAPVRVLRQANQGESVARNRGFDEARGEWLAFLDADDLWTPTKLARQSAAIAEGVVCIHTAFRKFGAFEKIVDRSSIPENRRYDPRYMALHPFIPPSCALVRRDVRARFETEIRYGEDVLFFLSLLREGRFAMVSEPLTEHRVHAHAQSAGSDAELKWHEAIHSWLRGRDHGLPASAVAQIERDWDARLAATAFERRLSGDHRFHDRAREVLKPGPRWRAALFRAAGSYGLHRRNVMNALSRIIRQRLGRT